MSADGALFSVIVVTYNNLAYTVRCIESLRRHWHAGTELILVDNGSSDGTAPYLKEVARQLGPSTVTLLFDRNEGWCRAINAGLARATGRYLVMLNNDVVVTPDWLAGLRACMEEARASVPGMRRVGLVGPMTNFAGGPQMVPDAPAFEAAALDEHARRHREAAAGERSASHFLSGFCLMLRREMFEEIGGLDERFSPGGFDDNDLILRAQERGWEAVIAHDVYVHHEGSVTFETAHPEKRYGLVNFGAFNDKWRQRRAGPQRLVAAYRIKNAEATLRESLEATARFADEIVVLDDGSSDGTRAICEGSPLVSRYVYQDLPFDERRDRNRVLALAGERNPDWVISVDADEAFEMDRARAQRLMHLADPQVKVLGFHWYTFWEPSRTHFRADGIFGNMSGFRMYKFEPGHEIVDGTEVGLHCGNIPRFPEGSARYTNVRVRHFGYDSEPLRRAKKAFYDRIDPMPRPELVGRHDYAHLTSGTVTLRRFAPEAGVSLCLIVKNEAERLERFLATLEPFVDEICLVDNGSEDDTLRIARLFTDRIEEAPSSGIDLDQLRNRALRMASHPWILSLDPDEEIALHELPRLQRLMDDVDVHAYAFRVANHQKDGPPVLTMAYRLFRNDPRIRYSRPIHETIEQSWTKHPELVRSNAEVVIQHYGFLKTDERVESKLTRYYERNQKYREDNPGDPMAWYNEALHLLNEGDEERAVMFLVKAMQLDPTFLTPRSQLAYVFQERAHRLWLSLIDGASPEHPLQEAARESADLLRRITPPRPYVGNARIKRTS